MPGESWVILEERMGVGAKCQGNARECMEVGAKCQGNAGEHQANMWELVESAREIQGNAGERQGNVWEWVQSARRQVNARGMYGSGCKVPGECKGTLRECMGMGAKYHGNAGE